MDPRARVNPVRMKPRVSPPLAVATAIGVSGVGLSLYAQHENADSLVVVAIACAAWIVAGLGMLAVYHWANERAQNADNSRLRMIADAIPVMVWLSGRDKGCTDFNRAWLDFTGRPLEEQLGDGWTKSVHPEDLDGLLKIYSDAFDARRPFSLTYRLRRYDGAYRTIETNGQPRHNELGEFDGYAGGCSDVTEQFEVHRAIWEQADRLDLTVTVANLGIWDLDPVSGSYSINDNYLAMLGRTSFDGSLEAWQALIHPEDRQAVYQSLLEHIKGNSREFRAEYRMRHSNGSWV